MPINRGAGIATPFPAAAQAFLVQSSVAQQPCNPVLPLHHPRLPAGCAAAAPPAGSGPLAAAPPADPAAPAALAAAVAAAAPWCAAQLPAAQQPGAAAQRGTALRELTRRARAAAPPCALPLVAAPPLAAAAAMRAAGPPPLLLGRMPSWVAARCSREAPARARRPYHRCGSPLQAGGRTYERWWLQQLPAAREQHRGAHKGQAAARCLAPLDSLPAGCEQTEMRCGLCLPGWGGGRRSRGVEVACQLLCGGS